MNKPKDEIKQKTMKEMLSENLRLYDEETKPKKKPESEFAVPIQEPIHNRKTISSEELDLHLLDLKKISYGKSILKYPRKLLHREILEWLIFPIQEKQTSFNQKTVQNLTQIFSETDYQSERIDKNIQKIAKLQSALSTIISKLEDIDDIQNEIEKINLKFKDSFKQIDSTKTELQEQLDSNKTELQERFDSNKTELQEQLDSNKTELQEQLDSNKTELQEKLGSNNTGLLQKLDSNRKELQEKLDSLNTGLLETQEFFSNSVKFESEVRNYYDEILGREPDERGLRHYVQLLINKKMSLEELQETLRNSTESYTVQNKKKLFKKYRDLIKKPIFIIGVPRSGTTLVHSILCAHKKLVWFSDVDIKNWLSDDQQYYYENFFKWIKSKNKKHPMSEEALFVLGKKIGPGIKQFGIPPKNSSKIPIEGEIFWRKYFGTDYVKDIPLDMKILLVKELSKFIGSKSRFIAKAPNHCARLFALRKIFPDCKFINVVRDPRAVVNSMMERLEKEGKFELGIDSVKFEELEKIERFSWIFNALTDYVHEFYMQYSDNFLTIYYEDLIANPKKVVQKILKFCDLETKSVEQLLPNIKKDTLNKWKKNLSSQDERKIFNILGSSLKNMKYPYKI